MTPGIPLAIADRPGQAQREIVDSMMIRLRQFLDGERDFDDAMTVEEYVVEVDRIVDRKGNSFG